MEVYIVCIYNTNMCMHIYVYVCVYIHINLSMYVDIKKIYHLNRFSVRWH